MLLMLTKFSYDLLHSGFVRLNSVFFMFRVTWNFLGNAGNSPDDRRSVWSSV